MPNVGPDTRKIQYVESITTSSLPALTQAEHLQLRQYLGQIRYLQGAFVMFSREQNRIKKWPPMSQIGLPWWRPRDPNRHDYDASDLEEVSETEIAEIDSAFAAGQDDEERGYAKTIEKCSPVCDGIGSGLRAFLFPDGCMSFFTFGFEVLRIRDEQYPRVVDQEIKSAAGAIGLCTSETDHPIQNQRYQRMVHWLSSALATEGEWIKDRDLHFRALARKARRGVTKLGREFLEQFDHPGLLQERVPFNLRGHYALRRREKVPRSLLILERARRHREQHFNFYGTFGTADVSEFSANTANQLPTLLSLGERLARVASVSSDQYDYERQLERLVAASGPWRSLTEAISRGPMPLGYIRSSQLLTFDRYQQLCEAIQERPLTPEEQSELTFLEREVFSAMHVAQDAFFAEIETNISQADHHRRSASKLVREINEHVRRSRT